MANRETATINYAAYDEESGIASVALYARHNNRGYTLSGQDSSGTEGQFTMSFDEGDGLYEFYTIARDKAGNVETAPDDPDAATYVDYTMPQSHCTVAEYTNEIPFIVAFEASDSGGGVKETRLWLRKEGDREWVDSWLVEKGESGSFKLNPFETIPDGGDGPYELMTISLDKCDNSEIPPPEHDAVVIVDRMPPESSISCPEWTADSPISVEYSATDALTGIVNFSLWYRFNGGDWQDTGHSDAADTGAFSVQLPFGSGLYEFAGIATDGAGNTETPNSADASCAFDTEPPVSTAWVDTAVNDTAISLEYRSEDALTSIVSVALYYRYTDPEGNYDDTLRDTGEESGDSAGVFEWVADLGPGHYDFYVSATDEAGNTEGTDGEPDATCLYDPRLALSNVTGPECVTHDVVELDFQVDVGADGYDSVTLYYRYGETLEAAMASSWATTATASSEMSGSFTFICHDDQGYYQFHTRAMNGSGLLEPVPSHADTTTLFDPIEPVTSVTAPELSASSEFEIAYTSLELYGIESIEIYSWFDGEWSLFTTVHDEAGTVDFSAEGVEGEYRFYSVGTDRAGNREEAPPWGYDCSTLVDLNPPESSAQTAPYAVAFPIDVAFEASDTVTSVTGVSLWAKFEEGEWFVTGLSDEHESGTFTFAPDNVAEGKYQFYTIATDAAGNAEQPPAAPDCSSIIDWTPPETDCSAPQYTNAGTIELAYSAADSLSGVALVEAWIRGRDGAWTKAAASAGSDEGIIEVDLTSLGEGTYYLCTRGIDNSGNLEGLPDTAPASTVYDCTPPSSMASIPPDGIHSNHSPVEVPYTASDSLSGLSSVELWFSFNGGDWEDSGLQATAPGLLEDETFFFTPPYGDGTYRFATIAADNAGNIETSAGTPDGGALVFDRVAPESSISCKSDYTRGFPLSISFEASDERAGVSEVSLWVSVNGSAYSDTGLVGKGTSGKFEFSPESVSEGLYAFYSIAVDRAGNSERRPDKEDLAVVFDRTAPISEASSKSLYSGFPIEVNFAVEDPISGVAETRLWVSFNGGLFTYSGLSAQSETGTFSYTPDALSDGVYGFYTLAFDKAGNQEGAPSSSDVSIMVDRTSPDSSCSVDSEFTNTPPIHVDYISSDSGSGISSVNLYVRFEGSSWSLIKKFSGSTGQFDFTPEGLSEGTYEFYTRAYDRASNSEPFAGVDDAIEIDLTPPSSTASAPEYSDKLPIPVSFSSRDARSGIGEVGLWYRLDDGSWLDSGLRIADSRGTFAFDCPDGDGLYAFYTVATDIVGNTESAPSMPDAKCRFEFPAPHISVSSSRIDFGEVGVGIPQEKQLKIKSVGLLPLRIDGIHSDSDAFEVEVLSVLPEILDPGESMVTIVRFLPLEEGEYEGNLSVDSNDSNAANLTIPLLGRGVTGELVMSVWSDSDNYEFGDMFQITVGCSNSKVERCVDVYLVLTYDLGGPAERHWSNIYPDGWQEGLYPL
ncbi:MAG: Ig-like domain repeat protein, partial [Candidatus Coatesbacteria bacterium]|nr:Ig-like domain repeat protein [Candidatus Coatesbacteria bacterium]